MKFIKHALLDMSVSKILLYYFSLWLLLALCATSCHGQTVDVGAFKESTLGAKLADAQTNGCALDSNVRCVLVLKPELNVFPLGTMPTRCARCVWLDWTGGGLPFGSASYSPTINGLPLQIPGSGFVLGMNHPGFDFSTYALGYPTITTLPLIAGSNTATFAPCPYGMSDTSGGLVPIPMNVHDLGAGSDEVVTVSLLSAGTPGSPLCTVTFTAANPHTLWSLQSATGGVQEAVNDNTTLAIWIRSKGTGFKAPVTTVTTSIYGTGEESALINGDPGNDSLIKLTGRAGTNKVRVSNFTLANQHSTVTDTNEHAINCISCVQAELDHLTITAGKVGVQVTSFGGGGQAADIAIHEIDCRGVGYTGTTGNSTKDSCISVNGDGVSLPSLRVTMWNSWARNLSTTGNLGPPVDFNFEDCDGCTGHHLFCYDDNGYTESGAGCTQIEATHDAAQGNTWFHDIWGYKTGTANEVAFRMGSAKIYNNAGIYNFHFDGYKNCLNLGQGYTADYQFNGVVAGPGECTNIDNSGAYGVIATGSGANFKARLKIKGISVTGTGAGTTLIGFRLNLLDEVELENNTAEKVAVHGFDFEGASNGKLSGNVSKNNGQTATGNGFNFTLNTAIGSSNWNIIGNEGYDSQSVPTQQYGFVNNSASNGASLLSGNIAWGNTADQFRDTSNKWIFGINFSKSGTNSAVQTSKVSPLRSGTSANTDSAGHLTLVAGAATYTFTGTYVTAPICTANDTSSAAQSGVRVTTSTTTLTINGNATDGINYMCFGLN